MLITLSYRCLTTLCLCATLCVFTGVFLALPYSNLIADFAGPNCTFQVNTCESSPCQNGGQCVNGVGRYTCFCPAGFTDPVCSTSIDDCVSLPCTNGGTCLNLRPGFRCQCAPGRITCYSAQLPVKVSGSLNSSLWENPSYPFLINATVSGITSAMCIPGFLTSRVSFPDNCMGVTIRHLGPIAVGIPATKRLRCIFCSY